MHHPYISGSIKHQDHKFGLHYHLSSLYPTNPSNLPLFIKQTIRKIPSKLIPFKRDSFPKEMPIQVCDVGGQQKCSYWCEQLKQQIRLTVSEDCMNFPFPFGHPQDRHPFYPMFPSAMPWSLGFNFQMPIPPQYSQPPMPLFAPLPTPNMFLTQQCNNFYAFDPSYPPSSINVTPFASLAKSMQAPPPPKNEESTITHNRKRLVHAPKQKGKEVIEVSDVSSETKKIIKKSKKSTATKEQRMFVELKRLSNKRFAKLDQNDRKNIQEELMDLANRIGTEPKRPKRTSERIFRQCKESGSFQYDDYQERKKVIKRQVPNQIDHNQNVSILNNTEIEVALPRILTQSEFEEQKKALREALLIRSSQNL